MTDGDFELDRWRTLSKVKERMGDRPLECELAGDSCESPAVLGETTALVGADVELALVSLSVRLLFLEGIFSDDLHSVDHGGGD